MITHWEFGRARLWLVQVRIGDSFDGGVYNQEVHGQTSQQLSPKYTRC